MEANLTSSKVRVFPASLRTYNGMGKYTTENNLTGIPRSVTDYDSFLLSRKKDESPFRFVIHGYYFEMDDMGFASPDADPADANYYIRIKVENANEYTRLVDYYDGGTDIDNPIDLNQSLDNNDFNFTAIEFEQSETVIPAVEKSLDGSYTKYTLRLTDKDGNLDPSSFIRDLPDTIGDREGKSVGRFEVDAAGSMGFSQPIYLKAVGGFKPINTIFWGSREVGITDGHEVNPNGKTQPVKPGDIFFGL